MQDKHGGQGGAFERREPTFGDGVNGTLPHNQATPFSAAANQNHGANGANTNSGSAPIDAGNFSALDDDSDLLFARHRPSSMPYLGSHVQKAAPQQQASTSAATVGNAASASASASAAQAVQVHTNAARSASTSPQGVAMQAQSHTQASAQNDQAASNAAVHNAVNAAYAAATASTSTSTSTSASAHPANSTEPESFAGMTAPHAHAAASAASDAAAAAASVEGAAATESEAKAAAAAAADAKSEYKAEDKAQAEAASAGESDSESEGNFLYQWRERRRAEKEALRQEKRMRKAGLLPKLTIWQRIGRFFKYMFSLGIKLAIVGFGVFVVFFIYFDAVVIDGYEVDDKWVLPAVVYSRPLELYPDQRLSLDQMVYELKLLQYREVQSPRKPGEYALNAKNGRVVLIKRPFVFPDGDEPQMSVLVEFDDKRVQRIINAETMQELAFMRMDPVLLDRINRINPEEDRIFISIDEVPKDLITTLIEIEDRSYYEHFGINPLAIGRAFVKNLVSGRVVEGGSTITQQLVKNYFLTNERSYSRKLKEMFMAMAMDRRYTKDQILEAYMNEIYLGQNGNAGIYGFGLASYFYFGVPVSELSLDQIALLVGLIKGPSYYDPWRYPDHALERRNTVLGVLRNRGRITEERFNELAALPIKVIPRGQMNYSKTPAFMGLVKTEIGTRFKEEEERTGKDFLSGNGIRIFTSLDPQAQVAAEKAVTEQIAAIEKERKKEGLEAAMIVSSWRTGEVSAVVGSSNPKYDGYNRVLDSRRQVGSLIKPFVYLTAFHQGYHLGSIVDDSPVQVKLQNGDIWAPKNDDKKFRGPIRVIRAMASSLNVPTVRVGMGAGLTNVINTIHAAGYKHDIPLYPSIVLGTPEISPYELNSMYVGMATEGIYRDLTTLRTIEKNGEVVYQRGSNRSPRSLDPKDTYLALYGMTEATRSGTGRRLGKMFPGVTIASKTGTTNDNRDTWAVGIDSDEIATVWVGYDNNKPTGLYGATGAMRLYGAYLQERGVNSLDLKRPQGVVFVNFDKQGNVLASGCEELGMERFPAREDRISYIKQCNNFGESGYDELPYAVPNRPATMPNNGNGNGNGYGYGNGYGNQYQQYPQNQQQQQQLRNDLQQQQFIPHNAAPAAPNSGVGFATGPAPNTDALNSNRVEDSGARDVDPVRPDANARPAQSSSQNVERQADAFEDELLGVF